MKGTRYASPLWPRGRNVSMKNGEVVLWHFRVFERVSGIVARCSLGEIYCSRQSIDRARYPLTPCVKFVNNRWIFLRGSSEFNVYTASQWGDINFHHFVALNHHSGSSPEIFRFCFNFCPIIPQFLVSLEPLDGSGDHWGAILAFLMIFRGDIWWRWVEGHWMDKKVKERVNWIN